MSCLAPYNILQEHGVETGIKPGVLRKTRDVSLLQVARQTHNDYDLIKEQPSIG
jgi:hypothetical protein